MKVNDLRKYMFDELLEKTEGRGTTTRKHPPFIASAMNGAP